MNRRKWLLLAVAVGCCLMAEPATAQFGGLFSRGPKAPEISIEQLRKLQLDQRQAAASQQEAGVTAPQSSFVLVDVRSDEELAVSIIPGAITKAQYEKNKDRYHGRTVITYCTIGGRSGAYAKQLIKDGTKAMNFKGSILGWCQANQPLVTLDGQATNRVHIYSSRYKVPAQYKPVW